MHDDPRYTELDFLSFLAGAEGIGEVALRNILHRVLDRPLDDGVRCLEPGFTILDIKRFGPVRLVEIVTAEDLELHEGVPCFLFIAAEGAPISELAWTVPSSRPIWRRRGAGRATQAGERP